MTIGTFIYIWSILWPLLALWLLIDCIYVRRQLRRAIEINAHNERANQENKAINARATASVQQLINAAKLVSIHRNGRVNVFTFIRNDEMFIIETMGLLGDDVGKWRKQAGLTE